MSLDYFNDSCWTWLASKGSIHLWHDIIQFNAKTPRAKVWLKGLAFPVQLLKKVFKNENGTTGTLYLVSNDMHCSAERLYEVYQKRGRIAEFHKSIKQNASLEKSPIKKVKTQCNHVYAAMIAYCKLEMLKFKTGLNHFAIKYKLVIRANQIAMQELKNMTC
jgi:IS4 transposase